MPERFHGNGAIIRISQENQCLPYAGFLKSLSAIYDLMVNQK